jgi:hypothetical protein
MDINTGDWVSSFACCSAKGGGDFLEKSAFRVLRYEGRWLRTAKREDK